MAQSGHEQHICCDAKRGSRSAMCQGVILGLRAEPMRRREFITLIGSAVAAWPLTARALQAERMRLIGVLMGWPESDPRARSWVAAFRDALAKLGWMEGNNLRIELRWSAANADRTRTLAKELEQIPFDFTHSLCA